MCVALASVSYYRLRICSTALPSANRPLPFAHCRPNTPPKADVQAAVLRALHAIDGFLHRGAIVPSLSDVAKSVATDEAMSRKVYNKVKTFVKCKTGKESISAALEQLARWGGTTMYSAAADFFGRTHGWVTMDGYAEAAGGHGNDNTKVRRSSSPFPFAHLVCVSLSPPLLPLLPSASTTSTSSRCAWTAPTWASRARPRRRRTRPCGWRRRPRRR